MIKTARNFKKHDSLGFLTEFRIADGTKLPFKEDTFDVVFSGGSTAFIDNKENALKEYKRVAKPWGFVADINFFYKKPPPRSLINKLNDLMGINIQQWDEDYWLGLYKKCNLEKYFVYKNDAKTVSAEAIKKYCLIMTKKIAASRKVRNVLVKRLIDIMSLFNENNRYLSYGVFICRKRSIEEQISLFDA
jgi:SAM-dependent methyltransferase